MSQLRAGCCLLLILLTIGCGSVTTRNKFYDPLIAELRAGNHQTVAAELGEAGAEGKFEGKDRLSYLLDAGLAYHYAGHYDSSNLYLAEAERTAEELYTRSVSKAFLANTFLNDNVLEYAGEDYEVIFTNIVMALNYIVLNKYEDAFVEIRRLNDKLALLEQKYVDLEDQLTNQARNDTSRIYVDYEADEIRFNNSALARYLSMHMYAADGKYDDARIDFDYFREAFRMQPHIYDFAPPDVTYRSDQPVLSVIAFAGLEPTKEALDLRIRTDERLDLLTIIYTDSTERNNTFANFPLPDGVGDFYGKLSIPQLVFRPSQVDRINIHSGEKLLGQLRLVEDIDRIAQETFRAKQSLILWRTIIRTLTKSFAASKLKNEVDDGGVAGWLGKLAVDVIQDISENADLRGTQLLPKRVYVGDFEIPAGQYDFTVHFIDSYGQVLDTKTFTDVDVHERNFNLLQTFCLK